MTTKIIVTAAVSALVAFGAGTYVGANQQATVPPPVVPDQSSLVASLRQDNEQLTTHLASLNADLARLQVTSAELVAQPPAPPVAAKSLNIGGQRHELQQAMMNNLRQIDAARKQFQIDKGHVASSIQDLVGTGRYIKTVRTVGGENYWALSMMPGQPLTVVTPDGVTVTFDPAGTMTTKIEVPPAVARMQELGAKVQPSLLRAVEAYRKAHNGANPPNEEVILAHFATPQEGADYVEFMEARKEASK